jgi:hypothetical protein
MTTEQVTAALGLVSAMATLGLVGITVWYAVSTARMLREMERQAEASHEQSLILSKAAQIAAWVGYSNAAVQNSALLTQTAPMQPNPFKKVLQLAGELEQLDAQRARASKVQV